MKLTEAEWKEKLTPQQYKILREKGTEAPFTGELLKIKEKGVYKCAACGNELFDSETKFESGSGWPSFYDAIAKDKIKLVDDFSHGMQRVEVQCSNCESHLGHLFDDGPSETTGMRYCINSICLKFEEDGE